MNKKLLLIIALAGTAIANARQLTKVEQQNTRKLILHSLLNTNTAAAAKTTAGTGERIIATSVYGAKPDGMGGGVWALTDSQTYVYGAGRNSHFNYNGMECTNNFTGYGSAPFTPVPGFTVRNARPDLRADKSKHWATDWSSATYDFVLADTTAITYTAANDVLVHDNYLVYTSGTMSPGARYANTYNSSGDIQAIYLSIQNGTTWDSLQRRYLVYNSTGTLLTDSTWQYTGSAWELNDKFTYIYDGMNRVTDMSYFGWDAATWTESYRWHMEYNSAGQLTVLTGFDIDGAGTPVLSYTDSFGYTGTLTYITSENYREYDMGALVDHILTEKHINSVNSKPDTMMMYTFDLATGDVTGQQLTEYIYDAFDEPVTANEWFYLFATGSYNPLRTTNYYYETYDNTGVNDATAKASLAVYPNPAKEVVYLAAASSMLGTTLHINIINTAGSVVQSADFACNGNATPLYLNGLAAGVYALVAEDAATHHRYRQMLVKQ